MNFTPLFDRVLIQREDEMETIGDEGIIVVPETAREKPMQGTVISIGFEVENVQPGDTILARKFAGFDIKLGDIDYLIIVEKDILGVLNDDEG